MLANYQVTVNFNDGTYNYNLPDVYAISDPKEGEKATIIEGIRADGSIKIPGGKKSQTFTIRGVLVNHLGYPSLMTDIATLKSSITTSPATLTCKHYDGGWYTDWSYTVARLGEIRFTESLRIDYQEYEVDFLILSY
jgi:hypothetical protein